MAARAPARERLKTFIEKAGIKQSGAAKLLKVEAASISMWLSGDSVPRGVMRKVIERWTNGEIREDDWLTDDERERLKAVRPLATGTGGR